jgi:hypothetical protein
MFFNKEIYIPGWAILKATNLYLPKTIYRLNVIFDQCFSIAFRSDLHLPVMYIVTKYGTIPATLIELMQMLQWRLDMHNEYF